MTSGKETIVEVKLSFSVSSASSIHRLAPEEDWQAAAAAALQDCQRLGAFVLRVGLLVWTDSVPDSRHRGKARSRAHLGEAVQEPYLLHYLVYRVNPLSQAPVQLLACPPPRLAWLRHCCVPRLSQRLCPAVTPPHIAAECNYKSTLMHMQASLAMHVYTTSVLFTHGPLVAAAAPNETTLFIVQCDSSGLTIRLIMSHWILMDACLYWYSPRNWCHFSELPWIPTLPAKWPNNNYDNNDSTMWRLSFKTTGRRMPAGVWE